MPAMDYFSIDQSHVGMITPGVYFVKPFYSDLRITIQETRGEIFLGPAG